MSLVILNITAEAVRAPSGTPADPAAADATGPADEFGDVLAAKLHVTLEPATKSPQVSAGSSTPLEAKIEKLLRSGMSQTAIVARLAAELAAKVGATLGDQSAHVQAQLRTVFARALAPPGQPGGALQTIAQSAHALAQRFRKIETLADSVAADDSGQRNQLAGTFLDAGLARETPVPASAKVSATERSFITDRPVGLPAAAAIAAVPVVAPPAAGFPSGVTPLSGVAPAAAPAAGHTTDAAAISASNALGVEAAAANTVAQPATGDGRRVAIDPESAIAGNGDSALGRMLTRAALAADARSAVSFAVATAARTSVESPGRVKAHLGESAVAAFVKAFESALPPSHEAVPIAPVAPPGSNVPAVAPFRIEPVAPAAAGATATHTPPAGQSAIADQVLRGIVMRSTGASSEMRLSLKPETLGDVNVKLTVIAGNVTAHVVADTPEVRDALVAAVPQLTKSLADAGLKLDGLTVDLSGNGFAGSQRDGDRAQRDRELPATAIADGDGDDTTLDAIPSFAPATSGAGDYNYLV